MASLVLGDNVWSDRPCSFCVYAVYRWTIGSDCKILFRFFVYCTLLL